jgi:large subunit ribosomal protein L22
MSFTIRATGRYIPMSPRKVRLVVDMVRGRTAEEAVALLRLSPKAAARPVGKVLASALANAEENYGLGLDELVVAEIFADEGPTAKRGRFGARGRWKPLRKRSCHVTVGLQESEPGESAVPVATTHRAGAHDEEED